MTTTWHPAGTGYPAIPPPPTAPGGQPLAEFSDRLLAYLIDGAICLAVLSVPLMVGFVGLVRWMAHLSDGEQQRWLDGLWQLWDKPYRQCLHDKGAHTVVIKVDG